jgi:flagellin
MVLSINTNSGALVALQNLTKTTNQLEVSQLRVTTGFKVNGPKDDAATYAIAQNLRGDVAGTEAVKTALASGESTINVAIEAGKAIADLLTEMKAKVVQANQAGLDSASRTALHNDFTALRDQLTTIVATAEFNGVNLIKSGATALAVLSTAEGSTISVSAQSMDTATLSISASDLTSSASAGTALTAIDSAITSVSNKLASLGSSAKRIEVQTDFTTQLVDILKEGVGNLVDANLAEESAKLQALQIKQQLGVQALAIANAAPQSILALFQ